jgi:hypothetical protein
LYSANEIALHQFRLSEDGLNSLLDRYTDIASLVIPLWQQHVFAILHSAGRIKETDPDVANFILCHSALEEYFDGELRQ